MCLVNQLPFNILCRLCEKYDKIHSLISLPNCAQLASALSLQGVPWFIAMKIMIIIIIVILRYNSHNLFLRSQHSSRGTGFLNGTNSPRPSEFWPRAYSRKLVNVSSEGCNKIRFVLFVDYRVVAG
jgi:hypothetical protein